MTIKELAEFTGKTERSIQKWVKKASEKSSLINEKSSLSSPAHPADYDIDGVELILNESKLGKNAVMIIMENARKQESIPAVTQESQAEVMTNALAKAMQSVMVPMMETILAKMVQQSNPQEQKTLSAPEMNYRPMLNQIVRKYAKARTEDNMQEAWGVLYEELYYRCHVSIRTRANNSGRSKLDEIEKANLLESAYLIMVEKLGE